MQFTTIALTLLAGTVAAVELVMPRAPLPTPPPAAHLVAARQQKKPLSECSNSLLNVVTSGLPNIPSELSSVLTATATAGSDLCGTTVPASLSSAYMSFFNEGTSYINRVFSAVSDAVANCESLDSMSGQLASITSELAKCPTVSVVFTDASATSTTQMPGFSVGPAATQTKPGAAAGIDRRMGFVGAMVAIAVGFLML